MSKQVDRIMDEVYYVFERHLHDKEEREEFVEELIEELKELLAGFPEDEEDEEFQTNGLDNK